MIEPRRFILIAILCAIVSIAANFAASSPAQARYHYTATPVLTATGEHLSWTQTSSWNRYEILRNIPGQRSQTFYVSGTSFTPQGIRCRDLGYRVRAIWGWWSNEVVVSYPCHHKHHHEEEQEEESESKEEKEQHEKESKENEEKKQHEKEVKEKEAKEQKEKEEQEQKENEEKESEEEPPDEEEETTGSQINSVPLGPALPKSGWSVVFGDAFAAPIGSGAGKDNTFFPNNCAEMKNCSGFNDNEIEVMNPSAVETGPQGLKLHCTYTSTAQSPGSKHYICGTLRGQSSNVNGYSFFRWSPGKGQTLVFQAVAKFPPNTGEADPGWWSNGPPFNDTEFDFFEGGGWGSQHTTGWKTDYLYTAWFANPHIEYVKKGFEEDPSLAYHTYTTEIFANNSYSYWIDGKLLASGVGPAKPDLAAKTSLILSYSLRTCSGCVTKFTSGDREFDVKSVSVYEDNEHKGVGIENGGLAPGTSIAP